MPVEDEYLTLSQEERKQIALVRSGVPRPLWGEELKWPGNSTVKKRWEELASDIPGVYDRGEGVTIYGLWRDNRMHLASWLAQHIMEQQNKFNRDVVGTKHTIEAKMPDGSLVTQPFSVKMMDVQGLRDLYQECSRDDDMDYIYEVTRPDFFFLMEIGYEWPNTYNAKVMTDLLYSRGDEGLPTVATINKAPTKAMDKNGEKIYLEIADVLRKFKFDIKLEG